MSHRRPSARLTVHDVDRMLREPPPEIPWLVESLIVRGGLTILTGHPGEGKSLLSQGFAVGVARGQVEAGLACDEGRALILDAENGEAEIHRRVQALQPPPSRLTIVEAESFDLRYDLQDLESLIEAHDPSLLVLDSFRTLWSGDENDPGEVAHALAPLQAMLRRWQVGGLLLHHVGKKPESIYRGSSAIAATCELIFQLGREGNDPERERKFLRCVKSRPAPEPPTRWIRLSGERGRVLLSETSGPEGSEQTRVGRPRTSDRYAPKILDKLREGPQTQADLARTIGQHPSSGTVRALLGKLREDGEVERLGEHGKWELAETPAPQGAADTRNGAMPGAEPVGSGVLDGVGDEGQTAGIGVPDGR